MNDQSPSPTPPDEPGSLFDHSPDSLRALLANWGEPSFRTTQVLEWVYARRATAYSDMTNLSKRLRERLADALPIYTSRVVRQRVSRDGTNKLLLEWLDGATTECVLIPDGERQTACISAQVGCPVGCVFCASGLDGLQRQLTAGQIVEQAMRVQSTISGDPTRLTNVVFMGLGEPLANYAATIHAVRTINAEWGMGVGARKITISTVGLPAQMRKLADERLQITLALSLHAPTDELRQRIIPWASRVSIDELIAAANHYFQKTGREVTLEYVLLGGLNDDPAHARLLAAISKRMRSNVNLIPYNPVEDLPYKRPDAATARAFLDTLCGLGVNAHLRRSRGGDIDGACGQLRRRDHHQRAQVPQS